jgi:FMN phosphatase YigB (HAD superfamily)
LNRREDFDEFYRTEFQKVKDSVGFSPLAAVIVSTLKAKGYLLALATNPLFPRHATLSRVRWAGLDAEDFALVTTYENSSYCKPNPQYYLEILDKLGRAPADALMIGNDVEEDACAAQAGLAVRLVTDCLINKNNRELPAACGNFADLLIWAQSLPQFA